MPIVCRYKPNRTKPRYFSARDAGRVVAYARYHGADDGVLLAYIAEAFGLRTTICGVAQLLSVLNNAAMLGAILGILKGIELILKGIKLVASRTPSRILGTMLEKIIPKKWSGSLGHLYLALGASGVLISSMIAFISTLANNVELAVLLTRACETPIKALPVIPEPARVGDIADAVGNLRKTLNKVGEEYGSE